MTTLCYQSYVVKIAKNGDTSRILKLIKKGDLFVVEKNIVLESNTMTANTLESNNLELNTITSN